MLHCNMPLYSSVVSLRHVHRCMRAAHEAARAAGEHQARLYVVLMVLALGSTALIVRAVDLQVVRKDFYQEQGDARFLRDMPVPVSRGTIFDRNGEPLAVSTPVDSIWADPQKLLENEDRLRELATALGIDADVLQAAPEPACGQGIRLSQAPSESGRRRSDHQARHSGRIEPARIPPLLSERRSDRRTCSATPTSTITARKASNWRSTTCSPARRAASA